jgi:hypothetical protein
VRSAPASGGCLRAQERKLTGENLGMAALRCTPMVFWISQRTPGLARARLASGATGRASLPISVGRQTSLSRTLRPPRSRTSFSRATELISATITPWGQAWVHRPQPEQ